MDAAPSADLHWAVAMQTIAWRGDQLTSSITRIGEQTFMTPWERVDILALTVALEDVLDLTAEFASKLMDYRLTPDEVLKVFFERVSQAAWPIPYARGWGCISRGRGMD
jgi:uncharacterized protein Yka (UPF0111/DUF47 family)